MQVAAVLCAVAWLALPGHSQERELAVWKIQVRGATANLGQYSVDLEDMTHHKVAQGDLRSEGYLEIRHIACGDYWITVYDPRGNTAYHGLVTARQEGWDETLDLSQPRERPQPPSGPVSVAQLRHPPSRKALVAFAAARKFVQNRQFAAAAEQLEKAVSFSPDFAQAHTALAAQYLQMGRFEEAIAECQRGIDFSQPNAVDLGNMAYAQFRLNRRLEAIRSAQAGLRVEPGSVPVHYLLGMLLAMDRTTLAESIPHLELAARTMASARASLEAARQALR